MSVLAYLVEHAASIALLVGAATAPPTAVLLSRLVNGVNRLLAGAPIGRLEEKIDRTAAAIDRLTARERAFLSLQRRAIGDFDSTGRLVGGAREFFSLIGLDDDDAIGDGWLDALEDREGFEHQWRRALSDAGRRRFAWQGKLRDGGSRRFTFVAVPLPSQGELVARVEWIGLVERAPNGAPATRDP